MPGVVELCRQEDFGARNAGLFDAEADFVLVAVGECGVDVTVASLQCGFDCCCYFVRLTLPGTKTDGWDGTAGV